MGGLVTDMRFTSTSVPRELQARIDSLLVWWAEAEREAGFEPATFLRGKSQLGNAVATTNLGSNALEQGVRILRDPPKVVRS